MLNKDVVLDNQGSNPYWNMNWSEKYLKNSIHRIVMLKLKWLIFTHVTIPSSTTLIPSLSSKSSYCSWPATYGTSTCLPFSLCHSGKLTTRPSLSTLLHCMPCAKIRIIFTWSLTKVFKISDTSKFLFCYLNFHVSSQAHDRIR